MKTKLFLTVLGATALASALPATTAAADDIHKGHRLTLISIGEIDDPMEDVLEHGTIFGTPQQPPA
ncbi:hypothetical protein ACIBCM_12385 [Streptomyces sp. NPDC051018]|uniref:hypothetical protein n=1 Tax=Streptomyces sp. NPDC051018 TaxID=3365639 RepID=UPI0037B52BC0